MDVELGDVLADFLQHFTRQNSLGDAQINDIVKNDAVLQQKMFLQGEKNVLPLGAQH